MTPTILNPAEQASEVALANIRKCIDERRSFLLEAGAGAGKTYSLIETLKYLIGKKGKELVSNHQQIACITYTNVAADEITSRTDSHPAICSSTIHTFCWSLLNDFQPFLRGNLHRIDNWLDKIEEAGVVSGKIVVYDLGYRKIDDDKITLHHDDVVSFMVMILNEPKFQQLISSRYPIIFIDEYQDTEALFAKTLTACFLDEGVTGPLIGFFGDHWQKIYGTGCGKIQHDNLERIGKKANFRSVPVIVNSLNSIRPDLPQQIRDPEAQGTVSVFHTNDWVGTRRTGSHWNGDLPAEAAHDYLESLKARLENEEWDFSPEKTKILMLTHNVLAEEQGYRNLAAVFRYNDAFLKKEDRHIAFLVDTLEPVCVAYTNRQYGKMFSLLGRSTPLMSSHDDKRAWQADFDNLLALRENGTIGDVIDHLRQTKRPRLPDGIENRESKLQQRLREPEDEREDIRSLDELDKLRKIAYQELVVLSNFLNNSTPFSTKHGVKGAEFENVLVVFGRGWNHYNFNQFLEWANGGIPNKKEDTYERNRNLFYVACSRPRKRLCLLFTQELSQSALQKLSDWFGTDTVQAA